MLFLIEKDSIKYTLKKLLGEGVTCKCYLGQKISPDNTQELFAIKIFEQKYFKYYNNEVNYLLKLSENENIIKLYNYGQGFITPFINNNITENENPSLNIDIPRKEQIYFEVIEYAPNGELKDYILGPTTRLPEKISAKIFSKIVKTMQYIHANNIAHCDIKPENILLDKNYSPKLSDFGFSQSFKGDEGDYMLYKFSGTDIYCAPETRKAYITGFNGVKHDIFSLGVLLFVITIGSFPFDRASYSDEKYRFIVKKNYGRFWEYFDFMDISEEFKDLINKLICVTPAQRLGLNEILEHPWIRKYTGINYENEINSKNEFGDYEMDKDVINEFKSRKV